MWPLIILLFQKNQVIIIKILLIASNTVFPSLKVFFFVLTISCLWVWENGFKKFLYNYQNKSILYISVAALCCQINANGFVHVCLPYLTLLIYQFCQTRVSRRFDKQILDSKKVDLVKTNPLKIIPTSALRASVFMIFLRLAFHYIASLPSNIYIYIYIHIYMYIYMYIYIYINK